MEVATAIQQCYRHVFYPSRQRLPGSPVDLAHAAVDIHSASEKPGSGQQQVVRTLRESANQKLRLSEDPPESPGYIRDRTPLKKGQISTAALRDEFRKDPALSIHATTPFSSAPSPRASSRATTSIAAANSSAAPATRWPASSLTSSPSSSRCSLRRKRPSGPGRPRRLPPAPPAARPALPHAAGIKAMLGRHQIGDRKLELSDLRRFVAGADVFSRQGDGLTVAQQYARHGITLTPASMDRLNGWAAVQQGLGDAENGIRPTLFIHSRCRRIIETLPALQHDPNRPEDVLKVDADEDGVGGDDAADALRYMVATKARTIAQRKLRGL